MSAQAMTAARVDHPADFSLPTHTHATGQLSVMLKGTLTVHAEEGWWLAPPGMAAWIPPGVPHRSSYSESSSIINVHLDAVPAQRLAARCQLVSASDLMRELALRAAVLCQPDGATDEAAGELAPVMELIILHAGRQPTGPNLFVPSGTDPRLRSVTERLRRDPGCNESLEALASKAGASTRTLSRLFVSETGMAFGRWREHLRVVAAVDRLSRGRPVVETALELGYSSASSFTALFTRLLGAPPRRYLADIGKRADR
jgi:AraC-like DNA-binding protein